MADNTGVTTAFTPERGVPPAADPAKTRKGPWTVTRVALVVVLGVLGLALVIVGAYQSRLATWLIQQGVRAQARLDDPTTQVFKDWTDPTGVDIYLQMVVWNITNPSEVMAGAKPHLVAVGPFTYTQKQVKHSFRYTDDHGTLWYKQNTTYHFVDKPCPAGTPPDAFDLHCSLPASTMITTPNVVLLTLLRELEALGDLEKPIVKFLNRSIAKGGATETLLMRRNLSDVVFGYPDPLLAEIRTLLGPNSSVTIPSYSIFANDSATDGTTWSAIRTRSTDGDFGQVVAWEGHNQTLNCWTGCDEQHSAENRRYNYLANLLNGTMGAFFQPNIQKDDALDLFVSDIYRSGTLVYNNSLSINGIDLYRFVLRPDQLANATINPLNCAFSSFLPTGMLNLTGPIGAPIFASKPWFFDGGPALYTNLSAYHPPVPFAGHRDRYDTFLDIEPESGSVIQAQKRLQINAQVLPSGHVAAAQHLREVFIPIIYANENTVMPPSVTDGLSSIGQVKAAFADMQYVGPIAGGFLLGCALLLAVRTRCWARAETETATEASRGSGTGDGTAAARTEHRVHRGHRDHCDPAAAPLLLRSRDSDGDGVGLGGGALGDVARSTHRVN